MTGYLIDTDWAIHHLCGNPRIVRAIQSLPSDSLYVSIISMAELYEGIYGSRNRADELARLTVFLEAVTVLGVDQETARLFGEHRARLRREGRLIDNFDLLIAATCLQHDLRLLTNNVGHFGRIEGLQMGLGPE